MEKGLLNLSAVTSFFKKGGWPLLIGLSGVLIISLTTLFSTSPKKNNTVENATPQSYVEVTEARLKKILEKIENAGKCEVMINFSTGSEFVFATQESNNHNLVTNKEQTQNAQDTESQVIIVKDENGQEKPVIQKEINPIIIGVVIVSTGAKNPIVKKNITDAVTTALDLSTDKISVITGN